MLYPVKTISAVFLYLMSFITLAQNGSYKIELLNEDDGFVSSNIYSILQDHQGFLWFGTAENGLMRYDGKKVSVFENYIGNSSSLSHNNAGNILLEKSGAIWVGTWGGGLNRYDPKSNVFKHFKNDPNNDNSISSNRVQSLYQDTEGTMWFGTYAKGLNRLNNDDGVFERFVHDKTNKTTVSNNRIWAIRDAGPNLLWVGTSYGLNLYDKKTKVFKSYIPDPANLYISGKNQIRHILQSTQGELYVGTAGGVFIFSPQDETFEEVKSIGQNVLGSIFSLIQDRQNIIWVATDIGLFQLIPGQKMFSRVKLPHKGAIRIVFEDKQGIVWATSEAYGIYKITQNRNFFEFNNSKFTSPNGLISDFAGNLIIATANGGLLRVQKNTKAITELTHDIFSLLPVNSTARKKAQWMRTYKSVLRQPVLHLSTASTLWFSQQSSLIRYNLDTGIAVEIEHPGLEEVLAINSTLDGRIWVGTFKNGLYVYDPLKKQFEHLISKEDNPYSLSHPEVLTMYSDQKNRLWIGTGEGLNLWDENKKQFHIFKERPDDPSSILGNIIQTIYQTRDGVIWVGTIKGLSRLDEKTNKFQRFIIQNDHSHGIIKSISEDKDGNLWLATKKGMTKLNPKTKEIWNYNQDDGLFGKKYYTDELIKTDDGLIYISGPRGIHYFNPLKIKSMKNNTQIVLTEFQKMCSSTLLDKPFSYVEDIFLSYDENFFSLEFSSLDLYAPQRNEYAYMLEGFDNEWVYIGNKNTASYTNLDGGTYLFRVKTSQGDGEWSDNELTIKITITPPLWKTWWAYCLYILTLSLGIFLYVRFSIKLKNIEINKQKLFVETLEQLVSQKTASLREKTAALEESNIELEHLTYTDALSGLYNRRYFDRNLFKEITRHKRQQESLSLVLCDIDFFKLYNDHYGHIVGDSCIQKVSDCMMNVVNRSTDSICRYGGEEFALILPNTDVENAIQVVNKVIQALAVLKIEHRASPTDDSVTMSYGIYTVIPQSDTTSEH
ncbi:MAG: diguanylate cyclase, partial [Paraglaciecola sp.]|nr:diguanylate cyclase [Paraglaciecola sp.]